MKRHTSLQPLSRDHHNGLMFCFRLNRGLEKNIDETRLKNYVNWFYDNHIQEHFSVEEKLIFPILGNEHELIKTALKQHQHILKLFTTNTELSATIKNLAIQLEAHIRFEERVLFNEIQLHASDEILNAIHIAELETSCRVGWEDEFWM
ncbi:MAG TPA: hemerythrin domain-containing protein [Bacteroidia bacterium]|nr:hemerythrin domain-containing protein [Bacteroidia bacterium]